MMNENEFQKLIETFGSEPDRWPDDERARALTFKNTYPEIADAVMREDKALDAWLDEATAPPASDLLRQRILNQAKAEVLVAQRTGHWKAWTSVAAMILAAFVAGYGLGQWTPPTTDDTMLEAQASDEDDMIELAAVETAWQSAATDLGMSDIYRWVEDGT